MPFPYTWSTEHFTMHYSYRSPYDALQDPNGYHEPLVPLDGVRQFSYVAMVGSFFERAWSIYQKFGLILPATPFPIYFQNLDTPLDGIMLQPPISLDPCIAVKSRYEPPWGSGNIPALQAVAAHELFHTVQECYPLVGRRDDWEWWAEATATFMEDIVFPGTIDYLKFLHTWFDEPSVPLDRLEGLPPKGPCDFQVPARHHFGGALFCRFLQQRFDHDLILDTWRQAKRYRLPFDALKAILNSGRYSSPPPLASSQSPDLFGSQFLPTNFFLSDPRYGYEGGALYEHFFQHIFVSRILEVPSFLPIIGQLDHLSAEYFLIRPSPSSVSQNLTVLLGCNVNSGDPSESPIKGVLVPVKMRSPMRGATDIRLNSGSGGQFSGQFIGQDFWQDGIDQALLIVVNTTWGENTWNSVQYELSVM